MQPILAVLGVTLMLGVAAVGADPNPEAGSARGVEHGTASEIARTLSDFSRLDADRSGGLLLSELDPDSDLGFNFWTYDRDGDGVVSRVEYDEYVLAAVDDD